MTDCFLFDLDGTLADDSHRQEHMVAGDWDSYFSLCEKDPLIEHVAHVARSLSAQGFPIIIISGRSDSVRSETVSWLHKHHISYHHLYLRAKGDIRNNSVMKLDALRELRANGYRPRMAFDDQPQTCEMWRSAGVPCAQVKSGAEYIEYKQKA